ncbi:hypothetical protein J2X65_003469 [Ancylobacter sp. 3268]|uniref:hypothetical protein n=1 Tax=Ancylobacter sp. 3268 TaxID=2817752 RepID=UPI00285C33FF|nr:hypothetical protein [Ancylobacter sp. 3268]MDR6954101.1 hypothetical protein [Ancylobacter sp. 3268]
MKLNVPGADHVGFDERSGRLFVVRAHNDVMGEIRELRRQARAVLAACDAAESVLRGAPPPPHFLDQLTREGI